MILIRPTLRRYFETGKNLSNQAFNAVVDSIANLSVTTAQNFAGPVSTPTLVAGRVSAGETGAQVVSARGSAVFEQTTHGSGATRGFPLFHQEATVGAAGGQIAYLPPLSSVVSLSVRVLTASSAAAGGVSMRFIDSAGGGTRELSTFTPVCGVGEYKFSTSVCAQTLQNVSGQVQLSFGASASAGAQFLGHIQYYVSVPTSVGAATEPCSCITSYVTGDRTAAFTVTTNITFDAGTVDNLVDGAGGADATDSVDAPGTGSDTINNGDYIRFDYGAAPKYVDEIRISKVGSGDNGTWKVYGGNIIPPPNQLASFTWDSITEVVPLVSNLDSYRFYELRKDGAGTWANEWIQEVEFKECTCP